jgi:periplasmic divalent cation tolerance protein
MTADDSYCVVLTTTAEESEAQAIATALVEAKLAACANLFPVQSIYSWQGAVQSDCEWQLVIKTKLTLVKAVSDKISALHRYDIPEIIVLPIATGSPDYLNWIDSAARAVE